MNSVGPFADRVAVHLGKRSPLHGATAAVRTTVAVVTGPSRQAPQLIGHEVPFLVQHDGLPLSREPTLFGEDREWLFHQVGAAVVTSRTYVIEPGDDDGLRDAVNGSDAFVRLSRGVDQRRPVVVVFAIHTQWLSNGKHRRRLIAALANVGAPVAIMLGGSSRDPLDSPRVVEGLIELLSALPAVMVLRCDHGALGAYAFGALGSALGLGTGTRHFIGPRQRGYADTDDLTPRVWVPTLHVWWKGSRLAAYDGDPLFDCWCAICGGASLARYQDQALRPQAELHAIYSCSDMADKLRTADSGRSDEWIAMCRRASSNLEALEDQTGFPQPASRQLKAWLRVSGVPVF